ncbi:MAG: CoA-binding protein [Flavobacteriaceae bacterium]|nr:CoA-binding protein [Bacteroidia bacterium]NNF76095.1 CoA-binding protein [Flavobacteriaceae bacterium]NNK74193.1 CoA-binding protein [Flavobacteriaceae bacterium]
MPGKTLVFGASLKSDRISNMAVHRLLRYGEEVVAFGIKGGSIAGVEIRTTLEEIDEIDTVTLYVGAKRQKPYYDYLVRLNPRRIIFNPGTENPEFYRILHKHDIMIDVSCSLTLLATNKY